MMLLHLQVCCFILAEKILAQSCEDEILTFASAGRIEASTDIATVGETVVVTCSSKCAWSWHTVLINGEIMNEEVFENEETKISVGQVIMNCPNCKEPDEIDCNDPSQGPLVSIVNLTLLRSGDHYVQCIAHLFRPDSELWPDNRLIAFPSRALKIKGMEKPILSESGSVFRPTLTMSSAIRMQPTTSARETTVTPVSLSSPYYIESTSIYKSVSIEPVESALMTNSSLSVVLQSSYFSSEEELRMTVMTLSQTIPSHNRNSSIAQSVTTSASSTAGGRNQSIAASHTVQAKADAQKSVACSVFSEENTAIFVVLGIVMVVCMLLITVIIVLMCVNRRNVALNNQLNVNLQEQNLSLNLDEVKRVK